MEDDFNSTTSTSGRVAVGGTASGDIGSAGDRDWFAVELVAGRTYTIDLRGSATADGTLSDPRLYGIHDADGNLIARTTNDDWGGTYNSQVTFTATETATHYIAAGAFGYNQGTYTVEVTDDSPADTDPQPVTTTDTTSTPDTTTPTDADAARVGATDLGNITALQGPRFPRGTLDGDADGVDYYRFTLTEAKRVGLGLRQQDADADLFLEDANGTVLYSSTASGTANERIAETLLAGTYYVRVESQEAGVNVHVVRYGVSAPDADALAALQQQSGTGTNEAPTFGQQGYAFALAENADGSANRVSLGTVAATDPEGSTPAYSLVGDSGSFEIDAASGELYYTGSGEDFESGTTPFTLTVRASDGSETADTTVTVNVTDVDEAPTFAEASYAFELAENADGGTERVSLGTVAATDPEGSTPAYSLVGDSGSFEIDAASGELFYTGSGEDYESGTTRFTLTVRASDGSETTDTSVTVNVTDVDETVDPPAEDRDQTAPQTVSEPKDEDFSDDTSTSGRVAVGETATADIETGGDRDWFAVELVAGRTYTIDLRGRPTNDGRLSDPYLYGVHDADGNLIADTTDDDGGASRNSQVTFTATESGTHYVAAGGYRGYRGTYVVEVTDSTPSNAAPEATQEQAVAGEDDFSDDRSTSGLVWSGGSATGNLDSSTDSDWFAVDLVAGRKYTIDLAGSSTGDGTLDATSITGVFGRNGLITGTLDSGSGKGSNSRVKFTATETGTHYISADSTAGDTGTYTLSVRDHSQPFGVPGIRVADAEATEQVENPELVFRVTLDRASSETVTVNYETADGTATAGRDYVAAEGTLVFAPGETEKTVVVPIIDDLVEDSGETVTLLLSDASGGHIADPHAVGTILNDETDLLHDLVKNNELFEAIAGSGPAGNFGVFADNFDDRTTGSGSVDISDPSTYDGNRDQSSNTITVGGPSVQTSLHRFTLPRLRVLDEDDAARQDDDDYDGPVNPRHGTQYEIYDVDYFDRHATDIDWFKVDSLDASKTYKVSVEGQRHSSTWADDPYLYGVVGSDGPLHGTEDNNSGDGFNSEATFSPLTDGDYYIAVGMTHGSTPGLVSVTIEEVM